MDESDDTSRLLDALRDGRRASDELFNRIQARCERYSGLSRDDRDDLSQECFLRIWERVEDLTNGEELSHLLTGTLRNLVRKRRKDARRLYCAAQLDNLPAPNPDGPTAAHLQEELDHMAERLRLESNERMLYYLTLELQADLRRIAVYFDVSYDCVRQRKPRLDRKLPGEGTGGDVDPDVKGTYEADDVPLRIVRDWLSRSVTSRALAGALSTLVARALCSYDGAHGS